MTTQADVSREAMRLRKQFTDHRLTVLSPNIYRLASPETSMYSVIIADLPTGVFLSGDASYGSQHEVFARWKSLAWFRGIADPGCASWDYVAGKFGLVKKHDPDLAKETLAEWLAELRTEAEPDEDGEVCRYAMRNLARAVDALEGLDYDDPHACYDAACGAGFDPDEAIADEYNASAVAMLFVVAEAFVREEERNRTVGAAPCES